MTDTLSQRLLEVSKGLDNQSVMLNSRLSETVKGLDNQSNLMNQRLSEIIRGLDSQSNLLNVKLERLIDSVRNQSHLLNRKIGEVVKTLESLDEKPAGRGPRPDRIRSAGDPVDRRSQPKPQSPVPEAVRQERTTTNDLAAFGDVFKGIEPWRGYVPPRCIVDFLGMVTDIQFHPMLFSDPSFNADAVGDGYEETAVPRLADAKTAADAEAWFEAVDWVTSAREARGRYVMITLGANYGAQAVGAYRALQTINPMPYKLVAVEPVPANVDWIKQHMSNNGIDPDQHLILPLAVSDSIEPLLFPVGGAGVGANNAFSTNERDARIRYAEEFIAGGSASEALRNLLGQQHHRADAGAGTGPRFRRRNQAHQFDHLERAAGAVRAGGPSRIRHPAVGDPGVPAVHGRAAAKGSPHSHRHPWRRRPYQAAQRIRRQRLGHRVQLQAQFQISDRARQFRNQ